VSSTEYRSSPLILLADDSVTIRSMVASRLERSGYDVAQASDGEEALELALRLSPDLAILDVEMPKLTGYELTRRLRATEETAALPIVLLTAKDNEADVAEGFAAGASEYVKKPFSPQDLVLCAQRILGR
jgi:DNA-binding response OmpR family regulator